MSKKSFVADLVGVRQGHSVGWWETLKSLKALPDMILSINRRLEKAETRLDWVEIRLTKVENSLPQMQRFEEQLEGYRLEVEEHTKLLSESLSRLDNNLESVLNNSKQFDVEDQLKELSLADQNNRSILLEALKSLERTEQELTVRSAIGTQGAHARHVAMQKIQERKEVLKGELTRYGYEDKEAGVVSGGDTIEARVPTQDGG